jgi:hypothetical protein
MGNSAVQRWLGVVKTGAAWRAIEPNERIRDTGMTKQGIWKLLRWYGVESLERAAGLTRRTYKPLLLDAIRPSTISDTPPVYVTVPPGWTPPDDSDLWTSGIITSDQVQARFEEYEKRQRDEIDGRTPNRATSP